MGTNRLLYLSFQDVVDVELTMPEIIESMERMFQSKGEGRTEMPPKPGIHPGPGDSFIHAMPASIPDLNSRVLEVVPGFGYKRISSFIASSTFTGPSPYTRT